MTLQPSLFDTPETPAPPARVSPARVRSLAEIIAGFAWPGERDKLNAARRSLAEQAASEALAKLQGDLR